MDIDDEGKVLKSNCEASNAVAEGTNGTFDDTPSATLSRHGHARQPKKARKRKVSFPDDECIVSKTVEPVDPWADASNASSSDVIKEYTSCCARLRVKPIDKLVKQLKEHSSFQNRISYLDLTGVKLDVKSCEALEEVFKRVQVYSLDIENANLEDEGAIALVEMIEFYHSAIQINIGYNPRIKQRGWQTFSQMIRKANFIDFIDMRHCYFNDTCIALMARSLKFNTTLRILHLEGDNLSGKLLIILCTGLKLNNCLTELFLGDNFLVPSDASTLSTLLKSNSTIQLLDVRNNMLQDQGLMHLCDGLRQQNINGGIKTLVLWNNQITCAGVVSLSNVMAVTKNIQTLNIGHNRLGNEGIRNLQIGLLKNKALLRLGLLNTKITAEGAVALAEYIADTRTLLRLDLRENDLFVGGLMALTLAVKINESVVRIDLDKDLKKEQGMEGTQTSLLVDIYQYLERNKKLGIEREQVKKKELELKQLAEKEQADKTNVEEIIDQQLCYVDNYTTTTETQVKNPKTEILVNCIDNDSLDEGNSRFTVSKVDDLKHKIMMTNCGINELNIAEKNMPEKCLVWEETKDTTQEHDSNVLGETTTIEMVNERTNINEELPNAEAELSDPEKFEKELDELLANVSGVTIDLKDMPTQDDEDFWNKDMQEILESVAN